MYDNSHEKLKEKEAARTPEEIEQANADLQDGLNEMYSADRLTTNTRSNIDERKVFDALDDKDLARSVGVEEARGEIAQVYDEMVASGSPEAAAIYSQEQNITTRVEAVVGEAVDKESVVTRVGAEVLNNVADGTANEHNKAALGSEDMTEIARATAAANLLEKVQSRDEELESFTDATTSRLGKFVQMVRNHGGVEKTSNKDLEEAGQYIEQSQDVQQQIEQLEDTKETIDSEKLAAAWVRGDEITVQRESKHLPQSLKDNVEALIAARKDDDETEVAADVAEMIAGEMSSAEYQKAS